MLHGEGSVVEISTTKGVAAQSWAGLGSVTPDYWDARVSYVKKKVKDLMRVLPTILEV